MLESGDYLLQMSMSNASCQQRRVVNNREIELVSFLHCVDMNILRILVSV